MLSGRPNTRVTLTARADCEMHRSSAPQLKRDLLGRRKPTGGYMKARSVTYLIVALLALPSLLPSQAVVSHAPPLSNGGVEALMITLAGKWRLDVYSDGHSVPVASGQREMRLLEDSTKLAWTETFVGQSRAGNGVLGYNAATGTWYVLGSYSHEPNPLVLIGRADLEGRSLVFDPLKTISRSGTFVSSELRLVDAEHFEWVASDGGWRIVFTRISHS